MITYVTTAEVCGLFLLLVVFFLFLFFFNEDAYQPGFELKQLHHFRKAASEWLGFHR